MKRRDFIHTSVFPLLMPGLLQAKAQDAGSGVRLTGSFSRLYFDERFVDIRRLSGLGVTAENIVAIRGDVTPVWKGVKKTIAREQSLDIQGITTESFIFCLQRLLQASHAVEVSMQRVDQNLYAWTLIANNKNNSRRIA